MGKTVHSKIKLRKKDLQQDSQEKDKRGNPQDY